MMRYQTHRLRALEEEGKKFTYQNFYVKILGGQGTPSVEWITWTSSIKAALLDILGPNSVPFETFIKGSVINFNGSDAPGRFLEALSYYFGSLRTAQRLLEEQNNQQKLIDMSAGTKPNSAIAETPTTNKIFVVHGHDEKAKLELENILTRLGLDPIILHRKADEGRTIIEKFEKYSDVDFAFILLTPDDKAYSTKDQWKNDKNRKTEFRARQNVIFEFGYFVGRLGRNRTCCLHTGNVALPTDISGVIYKSFEKSVEEIVGPIRQELGVAGYVLKADY